MTRRRSAVVAMALAAVVLTGTGIAWASGITLSSKTLGASAVTTPAFFPAAIATANVGPNAGKIEKNDTVTFTFSDVVNQSTVCSGWTTQLASRSIAVTWVVRNNTGATGNDVLAVSSVGATCASGFHIGTIDLGAPGYVANNNVPISNANTVLTLGASQTTVVVTFSNAPTTGGANGTVGTVTAAAATPAVWTPDTAIADTSGNTIAGSGANVAKSMNAQQF